MKVDISCEVDIHRPITQVAEFSADLDNVKEWYKNIHSVEWITDKPVSVG